MDEASKVLQQVLRCISSLGLIILTFGQGYSTLLLYLYGGPKLAKGQGPTLLRAHCLSVLLLAVNGVTECYAFATMTAQRLDRLVLMGFEMGRLRTDLIFELNMVRYSPGGTCRALPSELSRANLFPPYWHYKKPKVSRIE